MLFEPSADARGLPAPRRTLTRSETVQADLRRIHGLPPGSQRKAMQDFIANESLEVRATTLDFHRTRPRHAWNEYLTGSNPIVGFSTRWPKEVPYKHTASTNSLHYCKPVRLRPSKPTQLPRLLAPPPQPRAVPTPSSAPFAWE